MAQGITETKEAIDGAFAVVRALKSASQGGFTFQDMFGHLAEGPLKEALKQATEGAGKIPEEITDLDISEGAELAMHTLSQIQSTF